LPRGHLAEDRVLRRQARVRRGDHEELAPRAAWGLGRRLGHGHRPPGVTRASRRGLRDRVARATGSGLGWIAALDHEAGNYAMEDGVAIDALSHHVDEGTDRL